MGSLPFPVASVANANSEPNDVLRSAVEVCPFGIVIAEPLGKIVLANSETVEMFGYAQDELIGRQVDILVPSILRAEDTQQHTQLAADPQRCVVRNRKLSGRRKDGTEFPIEIGHNPIHTHRGPLILSTIVDVSERDRIEGLKDEFVSTVSHELRTPLTSIAGALALLVKDADGKLPGATVRLLTIAHANSQRLVRLVNSILAMEKIESGKIVFVLKRVDVRSLVEHAIEATLGYAQGFGVRIRLDAASAAGELRVDPDWLVQVLTNLLSNAIKFSPRGEEVVVTIEGRGRSVRISVRDHGQGIPEDFKPRIFEKFAQADATDARQQGGTGLGLSIVKQIVTRLGGEVGFDDAPGGGTIFHVELPGWEQEIEQEAKIDAMADAAAAP